MNWDRIEGNWKQIKVASRSTGASSPMTTSSHRRQARPVVARIQETYGITKDEAKSSRLFGGAFATPDLRQLPMRRSHEDKRN